MQAVVQAIFVGEEVCGQRRHFTGVMPTRFDQTAHVAAGAECLGPLAAQEYADNLRVQGPGIELFAQYLDHGMRQGVE
ncbi:hypothetical protein D3C80_1967840 [compost metagenome]